MFDIILATTKKHGIGLNGRMAWHCSEELKLFREKTKDGVLIVGRKTAQNLPFLKKRTVICVSRNEELNTKKYKNETRVCTSFEDALQYSFTNFPGRRVFVAGGAEIFLEAMKHNPKCVHMSVMKKEYLCDTFSELDLDKWTIEEKTNYEEFTHYTMIPEESEENQYLKLLTDVLTKGAIRKGRNGQTRSLFCRHLSFDLTNGFPLLTTKKMFWRGVVEELLFFIRGNTNSKLLEEKGINIWKGNTNREFLDENGFEDRPEGEMGPMYGFQWRHFNGDEKNPGIDQLEEVVRKICVDPGSRRILLTTYNPAQAEQGVLYPCHGLFTQFYVDRGFLDCFCVSRSGDIFLGIPFNIASYALLLCIIAKATDKVPRFLHLSIGDAHIYSEHYQIVPKQIARRPFKFPKLVITKDLEDLEDVESLTLDDFDLQNYNYHPGIKAPMIA